MVLTQREETQDLALINKVRKGGKGPKKGKEEISCSNSSAKD